jgi:hypothetical protein
MVHFKTFFASFLQIGLVAINTFFVTKLNFQAVFIVSCCISLLWALSVSRVAISTFSQKIVYALGAGFGAVTGLFLISKIF